MATTLLDIAKGLEGATRNILSLSKSNKAARDDIEELKDRDIQFVKLLKDINKLHEMNMNALKDEIRILKRDIQDLRDENTSMKNDRWINQGY